MKAFGKRPRKEMSSNLMMGLGFSICCVIFMALGAYVLTTMSNLNRIVDKFALQGDLAFAVNADTENIFEARVAALKFRESNDAVHHDTVLRNIDDVLTKSPTTEFRGAIVENDAILDEIRQKMTEYRMAYSKLITVSEQLDALAIEVDSRGAAARAQVTEIRERSLSGFDLVASNRAGVLQEKLLLTRYYISTFIQTREENRFANAGRYVQEALIEQQKLAGQLSSPELQTLAEAVGVELEGLADLIPQLERVTAQIFDISTNELDLIGSDVQRTILALQNDLKASKAELREQKTAQFADMMTLLPIILLAATGMVVALALVISRTTKKRFSNLVQTTESLAEGNLNVEIKGADQKHEFGRVARALLVFHESETERRAQSERELLQKEETERLVTSLSSGLDGLANGDLTYRIHENFHDEFQKLRDNFNTSVERLQNILGGVLSTSSAIHRGSEELASAASNLATRTEQQAAALAETTVTMSHIKTSVEETASSARDTKVMMDTARDLANHGKEVVTSTVSAMERIEQGSTEISRIIGAIDDIAFQTNLLALNAGVEAARAGSAGQGFAVVAAEARNLAQRAGEAAQEIKHLIEASQNQVKEGSSLTTQANEALLKISEKVTQVTDAVSKINDSTQMQATSISEIDGAMTELDNLTQQNAAMVEETTAASVELKSDVTELRDSVSVFHIDDSSRSEHFQLAS